jgi:hypothetical protein
MEFNEPFRAEPGTENNIFIWADDPPRPRVKFLISRHIQIERLGVKNPVNTHASTETCQEQRKKITDACRRAFKRDPSGSVSLTDADFEDDSAARPWPWLRPSPLGCGGRTYEACQRGANGR